MSVRGIDKTESDLNSLDPILKMTEPIVDISNILFDRKQVAADRRHLMLEVDDVSANSRAVALHGLEDFIDQFVCDLGHGGHAAMA